MPRAVCAVLVCLALIAPSASAQDAVITNPVWIGEVDGRAFADNYPQHAIDQRIEGFATLECYVRLDTTLGCRVMNESPASWGFGDAAMDIARTFRVEPARRNGAPIEGGRIRRTLRFVTPDVDWREGIPPEFRPYADGLAPPDLPDWDEAPTSSAVIAATPEAIRASGTQGRGILSCRVTVERRLNCEPLLEMPRNSGLAVAALSLAPQFRVSPNDQRFISQYASEPFLLPISFNGPPKITPVNRRFAGVGPMELPPVEFTTNHAQRRVRGAVTVLCTMQAGLRSTCQVESETRRGLGQVVIDGIEQLGPWPVETGFIPDDQVRITIRFQ